MSGSTLILSLLIHHLIKFLVYIFKFNYVFRCVHSASDALRVASFDFASLTDKEPLEPNCSYDLVVLVGHCGSGVGLVASNLAQQMVDEQISSAPSLQHTSLDFTMFSESDSLLSFIQTCADRSTLIKSNTSSAPASSPTTAHSKPIALVSVMLSAAHHVSLPYLLRALEHAFSSACTAAISVLAPGALDNSSERIRYASRPLSETGHGLGFETWRATLLSDMLQPSCCDAIILVEETGVSGETSKHVKEYLGIACPAVQLIKLTPGNLRLDQDSLDVIFGIARASARSDAMTERQACSFARGFPVPGLLDTLPDEISRLSVQHPQCPTFVGCGLTAVHITPSSLNIQEWNLQSVLQTVQLLFPSAKMTTSGTESTWKLPTVQASAKIGSFKRLIQLASAKVFCQRREEEGRRVFKNTVDRLKMTKSSAVKGEDVVLRLVRGIRTIHGHLIVPGGLRSHSEPSANLDVSASFAVLEANSAFGVLRSVPSATSPAVQVGLTIEGIFGKQELNLLEELFCACAQYSLPQKKALTPDQVSTEQRLKIQSMPRFADQFELPGNWWYDGQFYVDINGTRRPLRPDIDVLVDAYVAVENVKIAQFNELLQVI